MDSWWEQRIANKDRERNETKREKLKVIKKNERTWNNTETRRMKERGRKEEKEGRKEGWMKVTKEGWTKVRKGQKYKGRLVEWKERRKKK